MKPTRDPENSELKHLVAACPLSGRFVLEIGCGDGVFTRQYAQLTRQVVGIDPLLSELSIARRKNRHGRSRITQFLQGKGERLPFPNQLFDLALFASSL